MSFERLTPISNPVTFSFEGQEISAEAGETLAAALLAAGVRTFRSTQVSGTDRGPWCLMGACYDCMVMVAGPHQAPAAVQACMTAVRLGMTVARGPRTDPADG